MRELNFNELQQVNGGMRPGEIQFLFINSLIVMVGAATGFYQLPFTATVIGAALTNTVHFGLLNPTAINAQRELLYTRWTTIPLGFISGAILGGWGYIMGQGPKF